ncbi:MAG: lamin tail domain-containing protein [Candidatus Thiodiazotropha sp.]
MSGLGHIAEKVAAHANHVRSERNRAERKYSVLGATIDYQSQSYIKCQAFQVGSLGNFPYYWYDPRNIKFNEKTYKWISAGLKAYSLPVELDQPFTNQFIAALSKVSYSLSSKDKEALARMTHEVLTRQGALLKAWISALGKIPERTDGMEPIDAIIDKITQSWALPPTNLKELQTTRDLRGRLNKIPASGMAVLPALADYLNALQSTISLTNATNMNQSYLEQALKAVQYPSLSNGAIETNDGLLRPAYLVSTPLEAILQGLNSEDLNNTLTYNMSVQRNSSTDCSVVINSGTPDRLPISDFLTIETEDGLDLFKNNIIAGAEPAKANLSFMGITTVYFGPADFSMAEMKNWYWMFPINQAIANEGKDISGFKFQPKPQIDFAQTGPFGFLTGVTISKKASLTITGKCENCKEITEAIQESPSVRMKFLKMPLSTHLNDSAKYNIHLSTQNRDPSFVLNLSPSSEHDRDSLDSTAFVLCVQTKYPSAGE